MERDDLDLTSELWGFVSIPKRRGPGITLICGCTSCTAVWTVERVTIAVKLFFLICRFITSNRLIFGDCSQRINLHEVEILLPSLENMETTGIVFPTFVNDASIFVVIQRRRPESPSVAS